MPSSSRSKGRTVQRRTAEANRGFTMLEMLVASSLALVIALVAYEFLEYSRRTFVTQTDQANSQATARAVIEMLGTDIEGAGYSPRGVAFSAVSRGTATFIRVQSDFNGDGDIDLPGTTANDEQVAYRFTGPDSAGLWVLERGFDLNNDGDFNDLNESVTPLTGNIVQVDFDRNGGLDPLFAYNVAAPNTTRVTLTFGVRAQHRDTRKRAYAVLPFQTQHMLRNR